MWNTVQDLEAMQGMKNEADAYIFDDEEMLRQERAVLVSQFQYFLRTELPDMQRHAVGFCKYACTTLWMSKWNAHMMWCDSMNLIDRAHLCCIAAGTDTSCSKRHPYFQFSFFKEQGQIFDYPNKQKAHAYPLDGDSFCVPGECAWKRLVTAITP